MVYLQGRVDFFGNPINRNIRREFTSPTKIIRVKQLPIAGKPEDFTGAVGNFNFAVTANKNILHANETAEIKVLVSGKGNLKLFELPKIETPKELEVYEPERVEKIRVTTTGIAGSVTEKYTVVPQFKGKYKIPKVSFSYFNPSEKKYHTLTSEDLYVDVLEGKEIITNSDDSTVVKQNVVSTGKNFRFIETNTHFKPSNEKDFFNSTLFYVLLFLPLLSIPIGILIAKKSEERNRDIVGNKQRKADKLARKYLSEAKKQLGKKEAFYEALEKALHNYLKAKLGVETADISKEKITEILQNKKVDDAIIEQFMTVLDDCDFARYTPTTNVQMEQEYEKAKQVIAKLDKQL